MASSAERRIATAIIVLALGCQFFAVIAQVNKWGWPFTDYPMYASSHYEGERIVASHLIFATTDDGEEVEISANDLGLNIWQFLSWANQLVAWNEGASDAAVAPQRNLPSLHSWIRSTAFAAWLKGTDTAQADKSSPDRGSSDRVSPDQRSPTLTGIILSRYEQKYGKRIVRLRIEDTGVIVTKHGMQEVPRKVLTEVDVNTYHE
jgi:hypothetical protein